MIKTDLNNLNEKQREAVVSEHSRLLVLAGAGSGKTKTLLQKIIYLTEQKEVNPSQILAITFTKNATNEMIDRLIISADYDGEYEKILFDKHKKKAEKDSERYKYQKKYKLIEQLTIKTFHGFCYNILRNHVVNEFDNRFKVIGDEKADFKDEINNSTLATETIFEVFHKLLIKKCDDPNYLLKLKRYILDYLVDKIHINSSSNIINEGKFFTSLNGTKVRSKSEQFIADWFYRHNIKFIYEPSLEVKDFVFHPDFHIPDADLYIEHVSNKSYPTKDKEEQFKKGKLLLVKTFESMTKDSALFNHTLDNIIKNRLPENYNSSLNLSFTEEFNGYHSFVKDFLIQIIRVADMIKVESKSLDSICKKANEDQHERIRLFYELAIPIIEEYNSYCINKSYLDFNDLISRTILLLKNNPDIINIYRSRFKYILVDEFQDVNNIQVELVKMLLSKETQLFCVGDDWQSIYGFRGSNVNYIVEFEKHFDNSKVIKLNLNYRSTQNIVGASNEVIKNNKFKIDKEVQASKKSEHKIVVYTGVNDADNIEFCIKQVKELINDGIANDEILFLYRRSRMYYDYLTEFKKENINIQAKTIHAAKGLESKIVFIIGLKEGHGGFPDIWLEDRIFQIVKQANYDLLLEEERRLFYVALTRAKDKLFLITEKGSESSFIKEIPETFTVKTGKSFKPVVEPIIICKKCYSQLEKLHLFCPYCGQKVNEGQEKLTNETNHYIDEIRKTHKQAYSPWSIEDDEELIELFKQGVKIEELSKIFQRNIGAIQARIKKLDLL